MSAAIPTQQRTRFSFPDGVQPAEATFARALGSPLKSTAALPSSRCDIRALAAYDIPWDSSVDPAAFRALLAPIPAGTTWASLPQATKDEVKRHADAYLAYMEGRWGWDAFQAKTHVFLTCPTPSMTKAFDDVVPHLYSVAMDFPVGFEASRDVKSAGLLTALKKMHMLYYFVEREVTHYRDGNIDQDWDGSSFAGKRDGFRPHMPNQGAHMMEYAAAVRDQLRALPDSELSEVEKGLKQAALFRARSYATGSFLSVNGWPNGGNDDFIAPTTPLVPYLLISSYGADGHLPATFPNPEAMLEALNACWFNTPTKWLDVGSAGPGLEHFAYNFLIEPSNIPVLANDPQMKDIVKAYSLLRAWYVERVRALPEAKNKYTVFTPVERAAAWDSFAADVLFDNEGKFDFTWAQSQIAKNTSGLVAKCREYAIAALSQVFPDDTVLSPSARQQVIERLAKEPPTALIRRLPALLDNVTGNASASQKFNAAVSAGVRSFGGGYGPTDPVRPDEAVALQAKFDELKAWMKARYPTATLANALDKIPPLKFNTRSTNWTVQNPGGTMVVGLKNEQGAGQVYRSLMTWTLFSLYVVEPGHHFSGVAERGASALAREMFMEPFLSKAVADPVSRSLTLLEAMMGEGVSYATVDAIVKRSTRTVDPSNPNEPDAIAFVTAIAASWGLDAAQTDVVLQQSLVGSKYLHSIVASFLFRDTLDYLQERIDPSKKLIIDPLVCYECGVPTPKKDDATVEAIKTRMPHNPSRSAH